MGQRNNVLDGDPDLPMRRGKTVAENVVTQCNF